MNIDLLNPTVTLTEDQVTHLVTLAVGGSAFPTKLVSETKLTELAAQVEETYAKKTGYYESMTVGRAENLVDTKGNGTPQTYVRRTSAGTDSIEDDGTALIKKIKGNTIVWNQLQPLEINKYQAYSDAGVPNGTIERYNDYGFKYTFSKVLNGPYNNKFRLSTTPTRYTIDIVADHKYLIKAYIYTPYEAYFSLCYGSDYGGTKSKLLMSQGWNKYIKIVNYNSNTMQSYIGINDASTAGFQVGDYYIIDKPIFIDLTLMFGAGNEPSTVEEFEALFPKDYYDYNAGELVSFNGTGIKTVGFNQFNVTTGKANVLGGHQYQITGTYTALAIDGTAVTPDASGLFTPSKDGVLTVTGGDSTTCVHLTWSGYRNGEYEAYWEQAKEIPTLTGGLKSVGSIHDEITSTQNIQRIGVRAYQSGDEEDTSVLTDKTNTQYVLAEPKVTVYDEPLNLNYKVADFGTEEIIPEGVGEDGVPLTSPFVGDIIYSTDFTRELVNLPKNYQSQDSMDAALTALGTALGFTWSKTWDATNGKWTYVVTANTPEA